MAGEFDMNVAGADSVEAIGDGLFGQVGMVAFPAEVAEVEVAQMGGHDGLGCIGRGLIGEVAVPPQDALFQAPGAVRAVLEHFHVVIGFQHQDVCLAHPFNHEFCHMPEIREKSNARAVDADEEADGVLGVVRNGEGFDPEVADFETGAGGEGAAIEAGIQLELGGFARGAVAVDGNAEFFSDHGEALDVIVMFVGDEDAIEILGCAADGSQSLADLAEAESGIDQQAGLIGFEVGAIACGTAAKNSQVHGHVTTVVSVPLTINVFRVMGGSPHFKGGDGGIQTRARH